VFDEMSDWPVKFTAISALEKTTKEHGKKKRGMNWVKLGFSRLEIKEKKREGIIVSITRLSFVWLPLLFRDRTSCLVVSLKEHLLLPLRKRRRSLAVKMDHYYTNRLCSLGPMALFSKILICSHFREEKLWITRERTWSVTS